MPYPIPDNVRWLIEQGVFSMEHVDLLAYLMRQGDEMQRLDAIVAAVSLPADVVEGRLQDLVRARLLQVEGDGAGPFAYAYRPHGVKQRLAAEALAVLYNTRPVSLIRYVYERPRTALHLLADSFRLRNTDS